jgi:hypothetical protein
MVFIYPRGFSRRLQLNTGATVSLHLCQKVFLAFFVLDIIIRKDVYALVAAVNPYLRIAVLTVMSVQIMISWGQCHGFIER